MIHRYQNHNRGQLTNDQNPNMFSNRTLSNAGGVGYFNNHRSSGSFLASSNTPVSYRGRANTFFAANNRLRNLQNLELAMLANSHREDDSAIFNHVLLSRQGVKKNDMFAIGNANHNIFHQGILPDSMLSGSVASTLSGVKSPSGRLYRGGIDTVTLAADLVRTNPNNFSSNPTFATLHQPRVDHAFNPSYFSLHTSRSVPANAASMLNVPVLAGGNLNPENNVAAAVTSMNSTGTTTSASTIHQNSTFEDDPGWEEQFKALVAFEQQYGHCKVPARFKPNPKLGRWVMTQRRQFTLMVQGYPSALTAERIQRLEAIGFTWCIRPEPNSCWNIKFQELKAYKATFGNCMVPQRYQVNPQLGTWVHTQRRQYKLMRDGKKSSMTEEKAAKLNSLGFFWEAKAGCKGNKGN